MATATSRLLATTAIVAEQQAATVELKDTIQSTRAEVISCTDSLENEAPSLKSQLNRCLDDNLCLLRDTGTSTIQINSVLRLIQTARSPDGKVAPKPPVLLVPVTASGLQLPESVQQAADSVIPPRQADKTSEAFEQRATVFIRTKDQTLTASPPDAQALAPKGGPRVRLDEASLSGRYRNNSNLHSSLHLNARTHQDRLVNNLSLRQEQMTSASTACGVPAGMNNSVLGYHLNAQGEIDLVEGFTFEMEKVIRQMIDRRVGLEIELPPGVRTPKVDNPTRFRGQDSHKFFMMFLEKLLAWMRTGCYGRPDLDEYCIILLQNVLDDDTLWWYVNEVDNPRLAGYCNLDFADVSATAQQATHEFDAVTRDAVKGPEGLYSSLITCGQNMIEMPSQFVFKTSLETLRSHARQIWETAQGIKDEEAVEGRSSVPIDTGVNRYPRDRCSARMVSISYGSSVGPGPTGDQLAAEAGSSLHGQGQNPVVHIVARFKQTRYENNCKAIIPLWRTATETGLDREVGNRKSTCAMTAEDIKPRTEFEGMEILNHIGECGEDENAWVSHAEMREGGPTTWGSEVASSVDPTGCITVSLSSELLPATHWVTKGHIEHQRWQSQLVACVNTGIQNGWTGWKNQWQPRVVCGAEKLLGSIYYRIGIHISDSVINKLYFVHVPGTTRNLSDVAARYTSGGSRLEIWLGCPAGRQTASAWIQVSKRVSTSRQFQMEITCGHFGGVLGKPGPPIPLTVVTKASRSATPAAGTITPGTRSVRRHYSDDHYKAGLSQLDEDEDPNEAPDLNTLITESQTEEFRLHAIIELPCLQYYSIRVVDEDTDLTYESDTETSVTISSGYEAPAPFGNYNPSPVRRSAGNTAQLTRGEVALLLVTEETATRLTRDDDDEVPRNWLGDPDLPPGPLMSIEGPNYAQSTAQRMSTLSFTGYMSPQYEPPTREEDEHLEFVAKLHKEMHNNNTFGWITRAQEALAAEEDALEDETWITLHRLGTPFELEPELAAMAEELEHCGEVYRLTMKILDHGRQGVATRRWCQSSIH
ncbi:hypothetical protein DFH07DRAFT_772292 [Mycena maculata]|uniref:Uncharacterized protein n=1 Tax=Mycena maculata TaxID=230809 RepID=A0AAD7J9B2_9AGAR|nr:hypothetical protein DFH07DRAFT_772292 [Mycena maculata]